MEIGLMDIGAILEKALAGRKLFPDEAIHLCQEGDLLNLSLTAKAISRQLHPEGKVGYVLSRTVVYSNVCQPQCPFCCDTVIKDDPRAFTKSAEAVVAEVAAAVAEGATQITIQGGHRIDLPWQYYPGLIKAIKARFPEVQVLAFSPTEIMVWNAAYQKRTAAVVAELQEAGAGGMIAGGAQTMVSRISEYRALLRGPWNEWVDVVHRCADLRMPVIAPFVFGLGESAKERVGLLYRMRAVQERTANARHPAFSSLAVFTLQRPIPQIASASEHLVHVEGEAVKIDPDAQAAGPVSGHEYLRMVALARILVPNVPHLESSFVSQGAKIAQVALGAGADELGGTHLEFDKAELAAGRVGSMSSEEMERLIREAGHVPVRRSGS